MKGLTVSVAIAGHGRSAMAAMAAPAPMNTSRRVSFVPVRAKTFPPLLAFMLPSQIRTSAAAIALGVARALRNLHFVGRADVRDAVTLHEDDLAGQHLPGGR